MLLLLLLGVLGNPVTGGLVGTNHCQFGPAYWCANIQQASQCGALTHCIKAVWERQSVPQDNDEVCDICKDMVGQARDTLESKEMQEELKEVFDGSCDLIPLSIVAKECRTLADQFVPELVETLASEMNPDTVCTVAGLCNSKRIDKMLEKLHKNQQDDSMCNTCRQEVNSISHQLQALPDQQIEMKLLELCGYMGSYSDACMYIVTTQLQEIVHTLKTELTPEVCTFKGICSATTSLQLQASASEDIECEFCSKVIKHWIDVYASDASLQEFKAVLDGLCDKLDSKNSDHCKHIVDDYYVPLFEYVKKIDPHMVCSLVGLCGNKGFFELDPSVPITSLLTPSQKTPMVPLIQAQESSSAKPTCVLCEYIMEKLEGYLKDAKTEAEIKAYVDNICQKMPGSIRGECQSFVDEYEPLIVQMLVAEIDPHQICKEIKLCDAALIIKTEVGKSSNCETCQFVLEEVFSVLSNKDDQEMVVNVLESICYRLPSSIEMPCENFVDKYTSMVLELISSSLTPDEMCNALDLCGDKDTTEDMDTNEDVNPVPENLGDTGCVLCEYVISNVDKMLSDKTNEAEIKAALENVCSYLPSSVKGECDQFVESYTDIIIQLLTGEVTPQEVCAYLGLCKSQVLGKIAPLPDYKKGPYCTLCEYAINTVDQMLQDSKTEDEIVQALDAVCYQLTAPVHKECLKMVKKYTDEIIQLIVNDYTPEQICSEISLCVNSDIRTNDIAAYLDMEDDPVEEESAPGVGCVMCEFAMQVLDQHVEDPATIDQVERVVQFLCSYLPGSVGDACEDFVQENGQKIIDAVVNKEMNPQEVCTVELNLCTGTAELDIDIRKSCEFGPELWCSTPFHAKLCGVEDYCKENSKSFVKPY